MSNINTVAISGNLVRDCEVISTANSSFVTFTVAVNERRKNADGEWSDYANFFDCTMFGNYALALQESLLKGEHVTLSGHLQQNRWEKDGNTHSKVLIIVENLEVATSRA